MPPELNQFPEELVYTEVAGTVAVDLKGTSLVGIQVPAGLTSTALTFTCAAGTTETHVPLRDSANSNISVTCSTEAAMLVLEPAKHLPVQSVKVIPGSTQDDTETFTLVSKAV